MFGFTGTFKGQPISVQAVGMGCAERGDLLQRTDPTRCAQRIIRVGTAGGLADGLRMADTVVAISATADDPIVGILTDGEAHAPTATWSLVEHSVALSRAAGATVHVGPIVSSALFYDPREEMMQHWKDRGHLAVEMEAAVLYTLGGSTRSRPCAW